MRDKYRVEFGIDGEASLMVAGGKRAAPAAVLADDHVPGIVTIRAYEHGAENADKPFTELDIPRDIMSECAASLLRIIGARGLFITRDFIAWGYAQNGDYTGAQARDFAARLTDKQIEKIQDDLAERLWDELYDIEDEVGIRPHDEIMAENAARDALASTPPLPGLEGGENR